MRCQNVNATYSILSNTDICHINAILRQICSLLLDELFQSNGSLLLLHSCMFLWFYSSSYQLFRAVWRFLKNFIATRLRDKQCSVSNLLSIRFTFTCNKLSCFVIFSNNQMNSHAKKQLNDAFYLIYYYYSSIRVAEWFSVRTVNVHAIYFVCYCFVVKCTFLPSVCIVNRMIRVKKWKTTHIA